MNIKCPACQKKNENSVECQRCGADFTDLIQIRKLSDRFLQDAKIFINSNEIENAYESAWISYDLMNNELAAKACLLLAVKLKQNQEAKKWLTLVKQFSK